MSISTASTQCRQGHQQQSLCALQVLVLNLRSEMGALLHNQVDDCSDVLLNLPDLNVSAVAHNEDMTTDAADHTYFVHAQQVGHLLHVCLALSRRNNLLHVFRGPVPSSRKHCAHRRHSFLGSLWDSMRPFAALQSCDPEGCMQMDVEPLPVQGNVQWTAYTYAGELPTSAFGFNSAGIGFTLNAVFPSAIVTPGVARNFVSRQLLAATSFRWASSSHSCSNVSTCSLSIKKRGAGRRCSCTCYNCSSGRQWTLRSCPIRAWGTA